MLIWLILLPIIAAALIGLVKLPGRPTAIAAATLTLALSLAAIYSYDDCTACWSTFLGKDLQFTLALPLSKIMVLLSSLVCFAAVLGMRAPNADAARSWSIAALLISAGATGAYMSDSIIAFYAFHELALIPTFVMIGFYGRGDRRTIAWTATIYLGLASMVLLAGLIMLCVEMHAWHFTQLLAMVSAGYAPAHPCLIGGLLLLGFGALVSLFPLHSWAGPAYASAPTPVAMLHAGVLKKFGLYGLFTLAYIMGPLAGDIFGPWMNVLLVCLLGNVLWVGYVTMNKTRLDDMLGQSSVMHMGYIFLGFAAYITYASTGGSALAFQASGVLMVAHGLTIGMLFLLCGQIEAQTRTLELDSMGGLGQKLPRLGFLFGLAGMASIGLPLLANFPGEFGVFISCFENWVPATEGCCIGLGGLQIACICALWGLVIGATYMLRAFRNIFTGEVAKASTRATSLSCTDFVTAAFFAVLLLLFGVWPDLLLTLIG